MSDHAIQNAKSWAETIVELYKAHQKLTDDDSESVKADGSEFASANDVRERVQESALEVTVRSGWHAPGGEGKTEEFQILLSTGGPALRIHGDLGPHDDPVDPELQWQDWGTSWTHYYPEKLNDFDEALDWFCGCFYFGE